MTKVRLPDSEFLAVLRKALCEKFEADGTYETAPELQEIADELLALKKQSEG